MKKLLNFVNGEYVEPQSGKYLDNYNPATGEVYSQLPDSNEIDVVKAIQAANKAFPAWSKTSVAERSQILNKIADLIEARLDELAEAESRDVGKTLTLARNKDIPRAVANFRFFAGRALHHQEQATLMDGEALNYSIHEPVGAAALIAPWNLPLYLLTWKIAPCLAYGNTAVCKPSEVTPMTAYLLGEILNEAGLPKGVCNIVHGRGEVVGSTLVKHPGVPLISFTGGSATGKIIQRDAAEFHKKISMEMGGKNSSIVLKDADIKKAVKGVITSSFSNQGEVCLCSERLFIQQEIYDEFMVEFKKQTDELVVGDPMDEKSFMGPLVSKEHYEKVLAAFERMKADKGEVVSGGETPKDLGSEFQKGYFLRPTIFENLSECSELQQEEVFGPVVSAAPFKYAHEAIKMANATPYGLSASLWTRDVSKAHKLAAQLQAGYVWVNCWAVRDLRMPFGGMKASGIGRDGGDHSLEFFTEHKSVCVQL